MLAAPNFSMQLPAVTPPQCLPLPTSLRENLNFCFPQQPDLCTERWAGFILPKSVHGGSGPNSLILPLVTGTNDSSARASRWWGSGAPCRRRASIWCGMAPNVTQGCCSCREADNRFGTSMARQWRSYGSTQPMCLPWATQQARQDSAQPERLNISRANEPHNWERICVQRARPYVCREMVKHGHRD